jgi:hypothetical protein
VRASRWGSLDLHQPADWPLSAQLALLAAAWAGISILGFAALWREDLAHWRQGQQQQQEGELQLHDMNTTALQLSGLAAWLPAHGLGCNMSDISSHAVNLGLSLTMGKAEAGVTHGALVEATAPLLVNADYHALQELITVLTSAETAWALDPLNLTQGVDQQIELQGDLRCIRTSRQQETP